MDFPNLKNLFTGGASKLIDSAKNIINEFHMSPEDKIKAEQAMTQLINDHTEKMATIAQTETESYLKDTQSARDANVAIQNSDKASWLAKNVGYILDLFLGAIWGSITIFIIAKALKLVDSQADMTAVLSIYGTVTAVFMMSMNFHRGTSKGSEDKSKELREMRSK